MKWYDDDYIWYHVTYLVGLVAGVLCTVAFYEFLPIIDTAYNYTDMKP